MIIGNAIQDIVKFDLSKAMLGCRKEENTKYVSHMAVLKEIVLTIFYLQIKTKAINIRKFAILFSRQVTILPQSET